MYVPPTRSSPLPKVGSANAAKELSASIIFSLVDHDLNWGIVIEVII